METINGEPVEIYLENLAMETCNAQDPDFCRNFLFTLQGNNGPRKATSPGTYNQGYFSTRVNYYPGDTFTVSFENGTEAEFKWAAVLMPQANFSGIRTPDDFYSRFLLEPLKQQQINDYFEKLDTGKPPILAGYPAPFVAHHGGNVAGFFLDDSKEVAVLAIPSFSVTTLEDIAEFQSNVEYFLKHTKAFGTKKIIVDLSANSGGTILVGIDTWKQVQTHTSLLTENSNSGAVLPSD